MNINEFSIACKLINLKLRGFEIPKVLPPTLIASLSAMGGTPTRTPTSGMSPSTSMTHSMGAGPPPVPPQPAIMQQQQHQQYMAQTAPQRPPQPVIPSQPLIQAGQPIMTTSAVPPAIPPQPKILPQAMVPPMTQPIPVQPQVPYMMPQAPNLIQPGVVLVTGMIPTVSQPPLVKTDSQTLLAEFQTSNQQMPASILPQQATVMPQVASIPTSIMPGIVQNVAPSAVPAPPTPPGSGTHSRSMSISDRAPSIESPYVNDFFKFNYFLFQKNFFIFQWFSIRSTTRVGY